LGKDERTLSGKKSSGWGESGKKLENTTKTSGSKKRERFTYYIEDPTERWRTGVESKKGDWVS